jgi:hypothetical protein
VDPTKHLDLIRLAIADALADGDSLMRYEAAKRHFGSHSRVVEVTRAAIAAGSMADDPELLRDVAQSWTAALSSRSVFDAMARVAMPGQIRSRYGVVASGGSGADVAEGAHVPLTDFTATDAQIEPRRAAALVAVSAELVRTGGQAVPVIQRSLAARMLEVLNRTVLDELVALPGATSAVSSGDPWGDLRAGFDAVNDHDGARIIVAAHPHAIHALALSPSGPDRPGFTINGGPLLGATVVPTDQVPVETAGTSVIFIDAGKFAAASEPVEIRSSGAATLKMVDNPAAGPGNLTSAFQTNTLAILAQRYYGWTALYPSGAVHVVSGVDWALVS